MNLLPSYFSKDYKIPIQKALLEPSEWRDKINSPTYNNVLANDLTSLNPVPGDVIVLANGIHSLPFNRELNWVGNGSEPIWLLGNPAGNTILTIKGLELYYSKWVNICNLGFGATANNNSNLDIQNTTDCAFDKLTFGGAGGNNLRIWGTSDIPSSRLRFFNIDSRDAGTDCVTFHASATEEDIGSDFIIKNYYMEGGDDSGLDITSGRNFYCINGRHHNSEFHIGHGVRNVYVDTHFNSGGEKDIIIKNTDLDMVLSNLYGVGELDFGIQDSPRTNEQPNRLTGAFTTGRAKIFNFQMDRLDNNTGVEIVELDHNPILAKRYMNFIPRS